MKEAEARGLLNLPTTPDCVPCYLDIKNVELFARHRVYSEIELAARYKMKLDTYCKVNRIEALTMQSMVWQDIIPAAGAYSKELADTAVAKKSLGIECGLETELAAKISRLMADAAQGVRTLKDALDSLDDIGDNYTRAVACRDRVLTAMNELRLTVDELESCTAGKYWPYPSYGDILFSVR